MILRLFRRAHFVHPRAAIVAVAAEHEARAPVDAHRIGEALSAHVAVQREARVPFAELDAVSVSLQRLLHHFFQCCLLLVQSASMSNHYSSMKPK